MKKYTILFLLSLCIIIGSCGTVKQNIKSDTEELTDQSGHKNAGAEATPESSADSFQFRINYDENIAVFENHTYLRIDYYLEWPMAESICEGIGGYLAVISSKKEDETLLGLVDRDLWIGLADEDNDGIYSWVNGEKLAYNAWLEGNPDNFNGEEHYTIYYWTHDEHFGKLDRIYWNDTRVDVWGTTEGRNFGFICEFDYKLTSEELKTAFSYFYDIPADRITILGNREIGEKIKNSTSALDNTAAAISSRISIITVFDLQVENLSESDGKLISDLLSSTLTSQKEIKVIDRGQREVILSEMEFSLSGCADDSCQLEIGEMLAADGIITGSIGLSGSRYILNLRLLEVSSSEVINTASKVYKSLDDLIDSCKDVAYSLVNGS